MQVEAAPFCAVWCDPLDFSEYDPHEVHLTYSLKEHDSGGSVLFTAPKHYRFEDPRLDAVPGPGPDEITVTSHAFAKGVQVWSETGYIRTDDNFFDMEPGTRKVTVLEGNPKNISVRSVFDIR